MIPSVGRMELFGRLAVSIALLDSKGYGSAAAAISYHVSERRSRLKQASFEAMLRGLVDDVERLATVL